MREARLLALIDRPTTEIIAMLYYTVVLDHFT